MDFGGEDYDYTTTIHRNFRAAEANRKHAQARRYALLIE
jgi:hypothetical protein